MADSDIARLNIEHFKRLLARETDEVKRATLHKRLAEEEAKLAQALRSPNENSKKRA